ncbi:hypothetical protein V6N13_140305 [Hibiscus sabdariffa]|uniref:glutathione transferase n=1 Tax=Hibiscus sabdariffa TaxID=183260 RepID=A0ABR2QAK7_9ROSI
MAAMKVHGNPFSTSTQRVLACLYEKDVEFQFVNVDMGAGQHKSESFLSLNPFSQVPAFEQGDLKLFESRAITQYIAQEYSDNGTQLLLPESNKTMALVEGIVEENEAALAKVLDVYEARLAQSKYLAGDRFTLVDLHHLPNAHYLMGSSAKKLFDSHPHVSAWVADITARPAWSKVLDMQKQYP